MNRWLLAVVSVLVFCSGTVAQQNGPVATPPNHQHHVIDSPVIHGQDHPEQIPDRAAYGLFLTAVSIPSAPTDEEKKRQAVHMKMMHLSDSDAKAAVTILAGFNERRRAIIADYNAKAEAANSQGQSVDPDIRRAFFADLASLVRLAVTPLPSYRPTP